MKNTNSLLAKLLPILLLIVQSASAQTTTATIKSIGSKYDAQINKLMAALTLEEKVGMLHGNSMFATGGVPRLGIPELKMADGPLGVREEISRDNWAAAGWTNDFATYYPATGALAATWNTKLAYIFGNSVGRSCVHEAKTLVCQKVLCSAKPIREILQLRLMNQSLLKLSSQCKKAIQIKM